jgi:hypothetical protein
MDFTATIRGIPRNPNITEINVRRGPGVQNGVVLRAPVGQTTEVLDVQPDEDGNDFQGRVFNWFKLRFPDGRVGWARDDLIDVQGDGSAFGFGDVPRQVIAFSLTRDTSAIAREAGEQAGSAARAALTTDTADAGTAPMPQPAPAPSPAPAAEPETGLRPGTITVMGRTGLNMRVGPGTQHRALTRIPYQRSLEIIDARPGDAPGDPFLWIQVNYNGREGWVREDFTRLSGNFEEHGLGFLDQYPSPVEHTWWGRGFNTDPTKTHFTDFHKGWDHSGNVGEPLLAGPKGGVVTQVAFCRPCGEAGASALSRNFRLNDSRVLTSSAWNFGFGHYVVVRYDHDILPESTRNRLRERGLGGAHLFVIYAHMHDMHVEEGQTLQPNQQIGTLGNSGNSTGAHLHLEVRGGTNPNAQFYELQANLMTPGVLFLR